MLYGNLDDAVLDDTAAMCQIEIVLFRQNACDCKTTVDRRLIFVMSP